MRRVTTSQPCLLNRSLFIYVRCPCLSSAHSSLLAAPTSFVGKVDGVDEVQMIVTSADRVRPHVQTVTTYAADFDEIQTIELDADDVDEWQYAYTNVAETVYENQVKSLPL